MLRNPREQPSVPGPPELDVPSGVARRDERSVGAEPGDGNRRARVQGPQPGPRRRVPDTGRAIGARRDDKPAVRTELRVVDGPVVLERVQAAAASNIPDSSGAVGAVKDSDVVQKAGDYVQDAWESGTRYFQEHNFKDMAEDVAGVIRRNPIPAVLIGVGIGFLIARATAPRNWS